MKKLQKIAGFVLIFFFLIFSVYTFLSSIEIIVYGSVNDHEIIKSERGGRRNRVYYYSIDDGGKKLDCKCILCGDLYPFSSELSLGLYQKTYVYQNSCILEKDIPSIYIRGVIWILFWGLLCVIAIKDSLPPERIKA